MSRPLNPRLPDQLREALTRNDLEFFLDLLDDDLPGAAGSSTRKNYLSALRAYLRWATDHHHSVLNATPDDAHAYLRHLERRYDHKPATLHNHLTRVRKLYDILHHHRVHGGPNPFRDTHAPTNYPEEHRQFYEPDEITRLLAHASASGRALILLGAHAGLTGPEVMQLRWEHIDTRDGTVKLPGRDIHAGEELHEALREYGRSVGHTDLFAATGPLFDYQSDYQLRQAVHRLCRAANVTYKAWQPLRNSAALRLLHLTGDPRAILTPLGLTTVEATRPIRKHNGKGRAP